MPLIRRSGGPAPAPQASSVPPEVALHDGSAEERWAAARALAGQPGSVAILGEALRTEAEPVVRAAILTALARIGGPAAVAFILPSLRSSLPAVRTAAMDTLRAMAADVRPALPRLLADPDPDIRILSCEIVRELHARDATTLLCSVLLNDPEINVCAAAVDVLAEVGDGGAQAALEACEERFPGNGFLSFAIRIAQQRLSGGHG